MSLSREWVERLAEYARAGGSLVFSGNTADYNEYRQKREMNPLLNLADISRTSAITTQTLGKGKVVYIPQIVPGVVAHHSQSGTADETDLGGPGPSRTTGFPADWWVLPKNHQEIYAAIAGSLARLSHFPCIFGDGGGEFSLLSTAVLRKHAR
jgi:hypothetical protein